MSDEPAVTYEEWRWAKLAPRLAEALRDLLSTDPDMPSYERAVEEAEAAVSEAEAAGLLARED